MKRHPVPRLALRSESLRTLTPLHLVQVMGGRRGTISETDPAGDGPCPGERTWDCVTG